MATELVLSQGQALTPMAMLEKAVVSGAGIDVLERLMALSERWQANQAQRAFSEALSAARGELPFIVKNNQVDFTSGKGRTQYQYEDLAGVIEQIAPALSRNGLSFRWRTDSETPGYVKVTCILSHKDGHFEENPLSGPYDVSGNKNPIQAIGSVVTYLQRYTLKAAIGIAAGHDDDGRQGEPLKGEARQPAPPQGQPQKQAQPADPDTPIGQENAQKLISYAKEHRWAIPHLYNAATKHFGKKLSELTRDEAKSLQAHMREAYAAKKSQCPQDEQEPPPIGNGPEDQQDQPDAFSDLEGSGDKPIGEEGYGELRITAKDADIEEAALIAQIRTLLVEKLLMKKKDAASFNVYYMPESLLPDVVAWINDQAK